MAPQYALWPAAVWLVCLITVHATESNGIRAQDARAAIDSPETPPAPPQLAALPQDIPSPLQNPTDPAKVSLGRELFFDRRLSGDNTMSCATCRTRILATPGSIITVPAAPVNTALHDVRILDDLSASAADLRFVSVDKISGSGSWRHSWTPFMILKTE